MFSTTGLEMSLGAVFMPTDVYHACTLHALTVEKEEVMGLLIGKFDHESNAHITSVIVLQRSDKRKDRVEISTEQLHSAMVKTQLLSDAAGESINVLGWYHSHPHITVQPSHVDLRTQASYQLMDSRFVGLIFSVFNDRNKTQEMQVTCFQSGNGDHGNPYQKKDIPLFIEAKRKFSANCLEAVFQLPIILSEEDLTMYSEVSLNNRDPLARLHNDSNFVTSQCHILKSAVNPLMLDAENRMKTTTRVCNDLINERDRLLRRLKETDATL